MIGRFGSSSLRRRLLVSLITLIALVWGAAGYQIWDEAQHEVEEVFDVNLAQTARLLLTLTRHALEEEAKDPEEVGKFQGVEEVGQISYRYEHKVAFRIFDRLGNVMLWSPGAPEGLAQAPNGEFSDQTLDGARWRVFGRREAFGEVKVGMRLDIRDEVVDYILKSTLWPMPLGLLLVALLVWWAVGRGLRPLDRVACELVRRDAAELHSVDSRAVPDEVRPLVDALNDLLGRLKGAFENERRFTADASHELRTPLAAIRIQAQVAAQSQDPAQRARALSKITDGVDRATHLVQQLLTLARADAAKAESIRAKEADLSRVARTILKEAVSMASKKAVKLELNNPLEPGPWVRGDPDSLSILMRNLVDNAIRYTPRDGRVRVSLGVAGGDAWLAVEDTGPGIPEAERERMFERFHRRNQQAASGSGLGLSIVERIAQLHGATVRLAAGEQGRGLRVEVRLPVVRISKT